MTILKLFKQELFYRFTQFLLGSFAVSAVVASVIGTQAFIQAHDYKTKALIVALQERSIQRMIKLRNEARKFSKGLGFNTILLPNGQDLAEFYGQGKSSVFFTDAQVKKLADAKLNTLNHLRPVLREKIYWQKYGAGVIITGVRGEIYIKSPKWQKPIKQAIAKGTLQVGAIIAKTVKLSAGDRVQVKGKTFIVDRIMSPRGNEHDIGLFMNLDDAREILNHPGKTSGILALNCTCAATNVDLVQQELMKIIPEIKVITFTVKAQARLQARSAIGKGTQKELDDIKNSRAKLRNQLAWFAKILLLAITVGTILLLFVMTLNNARERVAEVALLRTLGVSSNNIILLFVCKAIATGLIGGIVGSAIGVVVAKLTVGRTAMVMPNFIGIVIIMAIGISVAAALIPALWAAAQQPAGILNRE
jgi:ABC-type lipoprotein release transport system permease subunit